MSPPPQSSEPPAESLASQLPASFRIGYADYLRVASVTDLLLAAAPGVVGIMVLTSAGGVVGYRQAKAGHVVKSTAAARFLP